MHPHSPGLLQGRGESELKKLRAQQKAEKQARKSRRKDKKNKGDGFFARLKQVFSMTREYDSNIGWWMALAFLLAVAVSFLLFSVLLPFHWITGLLIGVPFGLLAAMIVMNRRARRPRSPGSKAAPGPPPPRWAPCAADGWSPRIPWP